MHGEHGVGGAAAELAERALDDVFGELLEPVEVVQRAFAGRDALEDLEHALRCRRGRARTCRTTPRAVNVRKNLAKSTMQVESSTTTMPPEPIIEPQAERLSKSTGVSRSSAGRQPPEGPPSCTALNSRPGSMPPPMSKMTSRRVVPMGTSTRPVFRTLPVSEKILVPFDVSVPMARERVGAVGDDPRHGGVGLDVVEVGRLAVEAVGDRADVLAARHAAVALDRGRERRRLAADEGAGALVDAQVEVPAGAEDVVAEQAALARLLEGVTQAGDGERVLVAHVDEALVGADGEGGDEHALDHRVRVVLEDGAVHERAGVALVAVADDVLALAGVGAAVAPLLAGGEAGAAAAAQAAAPRRRR